MCRAKFATANAITGKHWKSNIKEKHCRCLKYDCVRGIGIFRKYTENKTENPTIYDVGLGYIKLGQPATTLSAVKRKGKTCIRIAPAFQRTKLLYFDEPTTGLHADDISRLLDVLQRLVDNGDTVVVIEHNLDVIKMADHIIDLGPEGGEGGGTVIAKGRRKRLHKRKVLIPAII